MSPPECLSLRLRHGTTFPRVPRKHSRDRHPPSLAGPVTAFGRVDLNHLSPTDLLEATRHRALRGPDHCDPPVSITPGDRRFSLGCFTHDFIALTVSRTSAPAWSFCSMESVVLVESGL